MRPGLAALSLAVLLAGCSNDASSSTSVGRQGDNPWDGASHGEANCGTTTELTGFVEHAGGAVTVVVRDGDEVEQLRVRIDRSSDINRTLEGAAGTWLLDAGGEGFVGGFQFRLAC